jgi:hypothetical protein
MGEQTMKREIYDEFHGMDRDEPCDGEVRCSNCGRELYDSDSVFEVNDASGHDIICMACLKKMSIVDLADLFGAELKKVRSL